MTGEGARSTDILIMGGGLAGLTLAIQLRQRLPQLEIVVLERLRHPVAEAAHKVGESTVEIGAHYFANVLGLREHLRQAQLKKFGFRFFFSEGSEQIDRVLELGASRYLATPAYQLDRGIFENYLAQHAQSIGVSFIDGASVASIALAGECPTVGAARAGERPTPGATSSTRAEGASSAAAPASRATPAESATHAVTYTRDGREQVITTKWLVDASGRAGLLKRKLDLAESNNHDANAIWFRIGTRIDINDWSSDSEWLTRCDPPNRWLSTNHLCGEGYWAWLIPLASGSHSVGIVADAKLHPLKTMNSFERALDWFREHQPRLARELEDKRHLLQDFVALRNFSYGCKRVFSGDRWAITGEAGVFLDPFYSPGSDFIAIANTYITELIAKDQAGEPVAPHARVYEQFYFSFYRSTLTLYTDQYAMFGDPHVMSVKVIWDYAYYWGVLCQLFFQRRLTDLTMLARLREELTLTLDLNAALQTFMREWSRVSEKRNEAILLDQAALGWFAELNRGLQDDLDDAGFKARLRETTAQLQALAAEIVLLALADHPQLDAARVRALLGDDLSRLAGTLLFSAVRRDRSVAA
jgi:flavin-dependent dehydrogenase